MEWFKRLVCRHSGGISFVRNIYGDEINIANARSVWCCKKCGAYVYMPNLGGPEIAAAPKLAGEVSGE